MAGDMVERVAQALLSVFEMKEQFSEDECPRAFARAAIAAMREPTGEMVSRAGGVWITDPDTTSINVWKEMIDEALR